MGVRASKLGRLVGARGIFTKRLLSLKGPPSTRRGYVPVCVGLEDDGTKRFLIRTTLLGDADFSELLYRSAEEYGFCNEGILRIPCGAKDFEEWITKRSKPKTFKVKPI
ncbi:hypothetical protein TIFTF001_006305 [Ficus carica]|uniref:Small auxin up regulated protein n=1 Tax=Ficus carica TaxID=3494 RepID=A0AA88DFJ8_FICCA|nr:hypothetical protein TIFTF001_006305 [Ficus carica]